MLFSPPSSILSASLYLLFASAVSALPTGAPACTVNMQHIEKMGGNNQDLGYEIKPSSNTYTPGQPLTFTVAGPKPFKGLLLYVASTSNPNVRVGNFNVPDGFHSNKPKCDAEGVKAGPVGAITHSSPDLKQPGLQFTWTPDNSDPCEKVEIHAVVAQDKPIWQILKVGNLECAGAQGGQGNGGMQPQQPSGDVPVYTPPNGVGNYDGGHIPGADNGGQQDDNSYQAPPPAPPSDYSNGGQDDNNAYAPAKPKKKCKKKHHHHGGQEDNNAYAPAKPKKKCKKHHKHHHGGQEDNNSYAPSIPKKKCKKHHKHHHHKHHKHHGGEQGNDSYAPSMPKKKCKKHHKHHGHEDYNSYAPAKPKKKCKKPKFYKKDETVVDYNSTPATYTGDLPDTDYKPKKKCKKHHKHGGEQGNYAPAKPKKKCKKKHHHHDTYDQPPPPPPVDNYQDKKKPCKKHDKGDYDNSQPTYDNSSTNGDSADGNGN